MRADKQFRRLGFIKTDEGDFFAQYEIYDEFQDCVHRLRINEYQRGEYMVCYYDYDLETKEQIGNPLSLSEEEMQACLKKIKEIKRRNRQ